MIFQGGGARLGTLLAAADALERIAKGAGQLEIRYVAGVSAGSIAGAALASHEPVNEFRKRLIPVAKNFVAAFEAEYKILESLTSPEMLNLYGDVVSAVGAKLNPIQQFLLAGKVRSTLVRKSDGIQKLLSMRDGAPLLPYQNLENALLTLFGNQTIGNLKSELTVFTTKLLSLERSAYTDPAIPLYRVLALSCAMPGVFRSFGVSRDEGEARSDGEFRGELHEYDGGLAGNLPVSSFANQEAEGAKTLCVAFPSPTVSVGNALDFARALLTCAMQSSVLESKLQTTETGGVVCELPDLDIDTFDFGKSLETQLGDVQFENLSHRIEAILRPKIDQLFEYSGFSVVRKSKFRNDDVAVIFDQMYKMHPVKKTSAVRVYLDGRIKPARATDPSPQDERILQDLFVPVNDVMTMFAVPLGASDPGEIPKIDRLTIHIEDANSVPVSYRAYLHQRESDHKVASRIIVFLRELLGKDRCPLRVTVRYEGDPVPQFSGRKWDFIRTVCTTSGGIDSGKWIFVWPGRGAGKLVAKDLSSVTPAQAGEMARESGRPSEFGANWVTGIPMSAAAAREVVVDLVGTNRLLECQFLGFQVGPMSADQLSGLLIEQT